VSSTTPSITSALFASAPRDRGPTTQPPSSEEAGAAFGFVVPLEPPSGEEVPPSGGASTDAVTQGGAVVASAFTVSRSQSACASSRV